MCLFMKLFAENIEEKEEKDTEKKNLTVISDVSNFFLSFWKFHMAEASYVTKWRTSLGDSSL